MRHRSSHETSTKTPVIILPFREASHVKLAHSSRIISHISHILSHHITYKSHPIYSHIIYNDSTNCLNFSKSGSPNPVTGSHPTVAFQCAHGIMPAPATASSLCGSMPLHPIDCPAVTSVSALYPLLYSRGFKKPSVDLPARRRASFNMPTSAENRGHAAEVPPEP